MAKRTFVQLAQTFDEKKHQIGGHFLSEKLDGMRCLWDGGLTTGMAKSDVPWANLDKDGRYKTLQVCTGLWSRYGNVIHAPPAWLRNLPKVPMEGELYHPQLERQDLNSIIKKLPDTRSVHDWLEWVQFHIFDLAPLDEIFMDCEINLTGYKKTFKDILPWIREQNYDFQYVLPDTKDFIAVTKIMKRELKANETLKIHPQERLPFGTDAANEIVAKQLIEISEAGGEGLMVRRDDAIYVAERTNTLLKVKKLDDAEGTVIGYITGRKTDKGSKLLGLMGALILELDNGKRLELSGFTDAERELTGTAWAIDNPETECPETIEAYRFPRGSKVSFKYRGLSKDKIPNEARYWRKYMEAE